MSTYSRYRLYWENERAARSAPKDKSPTKHKISAKEFINELHLIYDLTGDQAFKAAIDAIDQSGLIDEGGGWRRRQNRSLNPMSGRRLADLVKRRMALGKSLRLACATTAWAHGINSASFDGAVAYLERCYREHGGKKLAD